VIKLTAQEIKKKAWEFAVTGEKENYSAEWGKRFARFVSVSGLDLQQGLLLCDLVDLFCAYRQGRYDFQTADNKCKEYIKKFEEGSVNEY